MLIKNIHSIFRLLVIACVISGFACQIQADEEAEKKTPDAVASLSDSEADEEVPKAPKAPMSDPKIEWRSSIGFFPSDAGSAIERAVSEDLRSNQTDFTSGIAQVSHGTRSCNHCGKCRSCVDRDGDGMIGGAGIKLGVGPCGKKDCNCWRCPYNTPFNTYGPGEYAGPSRSHRVHEYRLRTGDVIQMTFLVTPLKTEGAYRLVVGDELLIESEADEELTRGSLERGLEIQPDGTVTLRLIGQVHAAGQTIDQLREVLEERYEEFYPEPAIDVTPVNTGSAAKRVREAISGTGGFDPQQIVQTVTPAGEIRLPRVGSVQAQGLTLDELKQEINLRYDQVVGGLEVEPSLQSQAAHNIFVLGEVAQPGRFNLDNTPTTVLGAIAMAGGHVTGANLRQVVVFRRGEEWELLSTLLDLRGAILGRESTPADEIWVRDGDVIILPSAPIRLFNNFVRQVFTEGIYGVVPVSATYNIGDNFTGN